MRRSLRLKGIGFLQPPRHSRKIYVLAALVISRLPQRSVSWLLNAG